MPAICGGLGQFFFVVVRRGGWMQTHVVDGQRDVASPSGFHLALELSRSALRAQQVDFGEHFDEHAVRVWHEFWGPRRAGRVEDARVVVLRFGEGFGVGVRLYILLVVEQQLLLRRDIGHYLDARQGCPDL